jgi:F-type H+-transporting ATPase subunit delta
MTPASHKAENYARALHGIAEANHCIEAISADLGHLVDFIQKTPSVRQFLASDDVTAPGKQNALAELLGGQLHPLLVPFTLLLAAAGDIDLLAPLATAFATTAAGAAQTATGEVHSTVALSPEKLAAIEAEVGRTLNRPVRLQPHVMNNILGGIRVKVGDTVIDGTLDTQLEEARRHLLE